MSNVTVIGMLQYNVLAHAIYGYKDAQFHPVILASNANTTWRLELGTELGKFFVGS